VAGSQARCKEQKPRGRPKKGTEKKKKTEAETVKRARYPLSKNPENLTGSQQATLEITQSRPRNYSADIC
jgi:hypothetical protein